jgi:hypothetical protein
MAIADYCIDTGPYVPPGASTVGPTASGGYECTVGPVRYSDVSRNASERALFDSWWNEQINMYGQKIDYYINGYNLSAHDFFYGEQSLVRYSTPIPMIMAIMMSNDNVILSKFGLQGDADLTALITINTFYTSVTAISSVLSASNYEPKSGDLIKLQEYGSTRPGGRDGRVFEITERLDEQGGENNQLLGHYLWMIKAKRFDYNYELDAPREQLLDQVYDNKADGEQNNLPRIIETKKYTQFVDKDSEQIFDYTVNPQANTNVYGDYDDANILVNMIGTTNLSGGVTGALGASAETFIVVDSPSNYAQDVAQIVATANQTQLAMLTALLSGNPALSSLLILPVSAVC